MRKSTNKNNVEISEQVPRGAPRGSDAMGWSWGLGAGPSWHLTLVNTDDKDGDEADDGNNEIRGERRLADQYTVEDEVAQTKFDPATVSALYTVSDPTKSTQTLKLAAES